LELGVDKHRDTNKDGGDTKHSQLAGLVVPQGEKVVMDREMVVVPGDPHDAKIVKRESEHSCAEVVKAIPSLRKVVHKWGDRIVVAPRVRQNGDRKKVDFRIGGQGWEELELFSVVLRELQCCYQPYVRIHVIYELANDAMFHGDARTQTYVPANGVEESES
jgi:hypothetical protein